MTHRRRLPNRRASLVLDLHQNGMRFTTSFSQGADGRVLEIFLQNHKPGSQSDSNARDSAVAASLALQFGCPLETAAPGIVARRSRSSEHALGHSG
jgi:hypothetical protein